MFRYVIAGVVLLLIAFAVFVVRPYIQEVDCPYCQGKGFIQRGIVEIPCPWCKSAGKIPPYKKDIVLEQMAKEKKAEEDERKAAEEKYKQMQSQYPDNAPAWSPAGQ